MKDPVQTYYENILWMMDSVKQEANTSIENSAERQTVIQAIHQIQQLCQRQIQEYQVYVRKHASL